MKFQMQHGVALITVMLIIALATILAVSMTQMQQLNIHRTTNILNYEQAYQYVTAAEDWAGLMLQRDYERNKTDSNKDIWATVLPALPIEGGQLRGQIMDLQSRFNLNNLVLDGKIQKPQLQHFRYLLRHLQLDENIADTLADWLDSDIEAGFNGAEDNEYLGRTPAYRTGNQAMQDSSELLLVKGVDMKSYKKLRPFVTVLKSGSNINVNTASAEVLASVVKNLSLEDAKVIIADRDKEVFAKLDDFLQHPLIKNTKTDGKGLAVNSHYFQLESSVQIDRVVLDFVSVIKRDDDGNVQVIRHHRGGL